MRKLKNIISSPHFKKISIIFGVTLLILSLFSVQNPKPFLKFGYLGIFVLHLLGAGAVLSFGVARLTNPFYLALATALGMAINDSLAWLIGRNSDVLIGRPEKIKDIEGSLHKYGPIALFLWSLIPFPYELIGFIAGYLEFPFLKFFLPTFLGKFLRTLLIGLGVISAVRILT